MKLAPTKTLDDLTGRKTIKKIIKKGVEKPRHDDVPEHSTLEQLMVVAGVPEHMVNPPHKWVFQRFEVGNQEVEPMTQLAWARRLLKGSRKEFLKPQLIVIASRRVDTHARQVGHLIMRRAIRLGLLPKVVMPERWCLNDLQDMVNRRAAPDIVMLFNLNENMSYLTQETARTIGRMFERGPVVAAAQIRGNPWGWAVRTFGARPDKIFLVKPPKNQKRKQKSVEVEG